MTIAPHFVAQGCLGAMVETGVASPKAESEYILASAEAMQRLVPNHLQFPCDECLQFMKAAMNRHENAVATS